MTFSIVATDGTAWGVAVASKFLAVGSAVPAAAPASARSPPSHSPTSPTGRTAWRCSNPGARRRRRSTPHGRRRAPRATAGRRRRRKGRAATFTGSECHAWAGGVTGDGYAIQGNILTGAEVVAAMEQAWLGADAAHRWLGGCSPRSRPVTRPAATGAAGRAPRCSSSHPTAGTAAAATSSSTCGSTTTTTRCRSSAGCSTSTTCTSAPRPGDCASARGRPRRRGPRPARPARPHQADLEKALADWAGIENLEERMLPGRIDPVVLDSSGSKSP